jgi:hypothetical protein
MSAWYKCDECKEVLHGDNFYPLLTDVLEELNVFESINSEGVWVIEAEDIKKVLSKYFS